MPLSSKDIVLPFSLKQVGERDIVRRFESVDDDERFSLAWLLQMNFLSALLSLLCLSLAFTGEVAAEPSEKSPTEKNTAELASLKLPSNAIRVPMTRQSRDYTCGTAALQSVLAYYGEEFREDELEKKLKSNSKDGTAYLEMARFALDRSFQVDIVKEMKLERLKADIESGLPVICLIQAWSDRSSVDYKHDWDDGHYVVAIGFDTNNIYFMDPSTLGNYTYIPISEFLSRWHDTDGKERLQNFGMVISKDPPAFKPDAIKKIE